MPTAEGPFREARERFDFRPRTEVVFGEGVLDQLGPLAAGLALRRTLIVADPGLVATGHVERAASYLKRAGISTALFQDFDANPDTRMVEAGRRAARLTLPETQGYRASAPGSVRIRGGGAEAIARGRRPRGAR